jgi:capsular polysaccharide biosynthesis protein
MKKFSRCVLILIIVAILSGAAGYVYENKKIIPMYESTTQLYVVPGEENEASIRANNGGLKDDFTIIFKSSVVISAAQRIAGTSEDIAQYLTVSSPANSNIVQIKCVNPDQNTAKKYVDAVASTAIKTTSIIPVKSIQILSEGTSSGVSFKPDLYKNTGIIAGTACAVCMFIEIIVCLIMSAFKSKEDDFNHEYEYERRFGRMDYIDHKPQLIETDKDNSTTELYNADTVNSRHIKNDSEQVKKKPSFIEDEEDILEKLENEVSDYFNEGKEEKKKKKHKHSGSKDTDDKADDTKGSIILENDEDDINDNISADLNDDISDNKNNNIKADLNDDIKTDISDNINADLSMFDEEYPDSENDKTKDDEDMSIVDELSDDELKNIEIEDQAAATIDDEEMVEKVLRESAGTFSSDVADIQEASRENYRILGTIKE